MTGAPAVDAESNRRQRMLWAAVVGLSPDDVETHAALYDATYWPIMFNFPCFGATDGAAITLDLKRRLESERALVDMLIANDGRARPVKTATAGCLFVISGGKALEKV